MDFYTIVLRRSGKYWVSLCLENGLVGQGETKDAAVSALKEALESFQDAVMRDPDISGSPLSIKELHEFLRGEDLEPTSEEYELRAVHA